MTEDTKALLIACGTQLWYGLVIGWCLGCAIVIVRAWLGPPTVL